MQTVKQEYFRSFCDKRLICVLRQKGAPIAFANGACRPFTHSDGPFDRAIDNQVSRLRRKIEAGAKDPQHIKTIWGGGYRFSTEVK